MSVQNIFIIRHAQSIEDLDSTLYFTKPDSELVLTNLGHKQIATLSVDLLSHLEQGDKVAIFSSPSKRVSLTVENLIPTLRKIDPTLTWKESNLLQKQFWGSVNQTNRARIEKERYETGVLRFNFPDGEKAIDFLSRTKSFTKTLPLDVRNIIIITHGFMMRVLLMHLLDWSEDFFDTVAHPLNCEFKKIILTEGKSTLDGDIRFVKKDSNWIARKV